MSGGLQAYTAVLRDGRTVGWYMDMLPPAGEEQDYMSVTIPTVDGLSARKLVRQGFAFADRSILLEVQLQRFRPTVPLGKKFTLSVTSDWDPEEIYNVACGSFETDRRFALDMEQKDTALKNEMLRLYIGVRKDKGDMASCLYRDGKLEGFNLWRVREGGRVMLGAVSAAYRNTGVAFPLYCQTLCAMREAGADVLSEYIASSNTASLDLHAMLIRCAGGAFRFGPCRDHYKKERPMPA